MLALLGSNKYSPYEMMFEKLKRHKVTVAQMHLMLVLASQQGWISMEDLQRELSKRFRIKQSAVSRMVSNLREINRYGRKGHNFLDVMKKGEDERFVMLQLNKQGCHFVETTLNI